MLASPTNPVQSPQAQILPRRKCGPILHNLSVTESIPGLYSLVYVNGSNFLPNGTTFIQFGELGYLPVTYYSSFNLSFVVPLNATSGNYSVKVVNLYTASCKLINKIVFIQTPHSYLQRHNLLLKFTCGGSILEGGCACTGSTRCILNSAYEREKGTLKLKQRHAQSLRATELRAHTHPPITARWVIKYCFGYRSLL